MRNAPYDQDQLPTGPPSGHLRDLAPSHLAGLLAACVVTALVASAVALGLLSGRGPSVSGSAGADALSTTPAPAHHPIRGARSHLAPPPPMAAADQAPAPTTAPSPPPPPPSPAFIWPVHGPVGQEFGPDGRSGIDIDAPYGTPIEAAAAGTIAYAGWEDGYGNLVLIYHDLGIETAYGSQSRITVSSGQKVTQGQTIGYEGSTGNSTGPHVHFEVRIDGVPHDPRLYVPGEP